jgi:uncharacterized protein YdhG (YjbR/CyaY superfamily)
MAMDLSIKTIDEYIARYPSDIQEKLKQIRRTVAAAAPEAQEKISYGLATFTWHGNLVHFGGYDTHIGFYPGAGAVSAFSGKLKPYETSKGTVRFPLNKPLPLDLIKDITAYCVEERRKKFSSKNN